jgi:hypothetical protein
MSRAFVREDADDLPVRYDLPDRDHPAFPEAAAWALLEGANRGDSFGAEQATGFRWGDPSLKPLVETILKHAREQGNERLTTLAERFLR